jgi:hypothetical protein
MELIERIERAEAELLWSIGDDSGPARRCWGCTPQVWRLS